MDDGEAGDGCNGHKAEKGRAANRAPGDPVTETAQRGHAGIRGPQVATKRPSSRISNMPNVGTSESVPSSPVAVPPAPIEAALPFRLDAPKAKLTRIDEHNRALGGKRFAKQDSVDASDKPHHHFPSRLERVQAQVVAIEARKVEGHKRDLRSDRGFVMSAQSRSARRP
jgi:hypothetical protein